MTSRATLLLLLLLFTPLLSHSLGQPSAAVRTVLVKQATLSSASDKLLSQGLLEEVAGGARRVGAGAHARDARLPLPTPQDIEALRKVAQILAMLGEQVLG